MRKEILNEDNEKIAVVVFEPAAAKKDPESSLNQKYGKWTYKENLFYLNFLEDN